MTNKLSETRFFNKANQMFNFMKVMNGINLNEYILPENLYSGRIDVFKGYKIPLSMEVYQYLKTKKILPASFDESVSAGLPNLHIDKKFPHSIFNLISVASGKPICIVDLSYKGKYEYQNGSALPVYFNVPDIHFFYMALAGYANLRLEEDPVISTKPDFMKIISTTYSLILTKIIDNMFPIASSSNTDYNKLYFLCAEFCLENMFKLPKEKAISYAVKTTGITKADDVLESSVYINNMTDSMTSGVDYQNTFPIDKFCEIICKEYEYITPDKFSPNLLMLKYSNRLTKNAWFALEHLGSFLTMIILSKGGLGIFNDSIIKRYLELNSKDALKEIAKSIG